MSHLIFILYLKKTLLFLYYRWGNWGSRQNYLPLTILQQWWDLNRAQQTPKLVLVIIIVCQQRVPFPDSFLLICLVFSPFTWFCPYRNTIIFFLFLKSIHANCRRLWKYRTLEGQKSSVYSPLSIIFSLKLWFFTVMLTFVTALSSTRIMWYLLMNVYWF